MENKKKFWKGALCGALIMFIICVVFGVMLASGVFGFRVGNIVSSDTNQKLQMIRALMAREYLYYEDISDEPVTAKKVLQTEDEQEKAKKYNKYVDEKTPKPDLLKDMWRDWMSRIQYTMMRQRRKLSLKIQRVNSEVLESVFPKM